MLKAAAIFQSGAVLQRRKPIRVWGEGDNGKTVTVSLGNASADALVSENKWSLALPAQEACESLTMTITDGADTITLTDMAIGDVYLAGGQSNMELKLYCDAECETEYAKAPDPLLRHYVVPKVGYLDPGEALPPTLWEGACADTLPNFSAVAYYFAEKLRREIPEVPIGILECYWGGSSACAWTEESYFTDDISIYMDEYKELASQMDVEEAKKEWNDFQKRMESMITPELKERETQPITKLQAFEVTSERLLEMRRSHCTPVNPFRPAGLYHTMLSSLIPYTIEGFLWYQGEDDVDRPQLYDTLLSRMIRCWRDAWAEELPFFIVQLPSLYANFASWGKDFVPIRAQQDKVSRRVPGCYLICTMDAGAEFDVHPKWKRKVGERLALQALRHVYGRDIESESPEVKSAAKENGRLTLTFLHCGSGLLIPQPVGSELELIVNDEACAFEQVTSSGSTLTIHSSALREDSLVTVRYQQQGFCASSLYSSAMLPVRPFTVTL